MTLDTADVVIVGAGAAGLMTAIACARDAAEDRADLRIACFEGARAPGAKILVSGGARCNVTNRIVSERDFWGGSSRTIRDVLRAFPAARAVAFFEDLGISLHEEADGKLFPTTNRARSVLDALMGEVARLGIDLRAAHRVTDVRRSGEAFEVVTVHGLVRARLVVLATGGQSLPKSGSDGFGYELARRLGHGHVGTTPALAPLMFDDERLRALSGVSLPALITIRDEPRAPLQLTGALLWTHFGASGPVALNASRHWARAAAEGRSAAVFVNVLPGETFQRLEEWLLQMARERPRSTLASILASRLPASVANAWIELASVLPTETMAHVSRDDRRAVIRALLETRLDVRDTRGYTYAEATAGGVPLAEVDPVTMESRVCPGLYLVGEILDVDGRIGGFNFQWAWSSGWVAGKAVGRRLRSSVR